MAFELPPRSKVGYLDPEIAGEGEKIIFSDGEQISWTPPPARPVIPDLSQVKSIARYFGRTGHQVWPAWLYHPSEPDRLVKNADEAAELGICYREASFEERSRYGRKAVWDWKEDCKWRPEPWEGVIRFDPKKLGQGKTYIAAPPDQTIAQHELVRAMIPAVAAAVLQALKSTGTAPASTPSDPAEWAEFQKFRAWQKSAEVVTEAAREAERPAPGVTNALSADQEWSLWEEEAQSKGIKVDGRWSLERLKAEVEKAA